MTDVLRSESESRVLLLTPTKKDAATGHRVLTEGGFLCKLCDSLAHLCQEIPLGAGAVILPEEAILRDRSGAFAEALSAQPRWSNLPVLVLTSAGRLPGKRVSALLEIGDVTLLKRPLNIAEFVNAVRAAMRDRRRQYLVRDHLAERERQAEALRENEERLQFALNAGRLGSWEVDLTTGRMECSSLCKENFGRPPGRPFTYQELREAIHPADYARVREAVNKAIEEESGYDAEYRNIWPDGSVHWVLARARAAYGPSGEPLRLIGVTLDVTERKRAEEALQEADRRKDEFLAMLAHELRNPLAPIRNGLQILGLTDGGQSMTGDLRDMMSRQVEHLARLVDDLLDVSRITRGKVELRKEIVDMNAVLARAVETARPLIDARRHQLTVSQPGRPVWVKADLTRMAQVVGNLLNNAAKYSEDNARINLVLEQTNGTAVVRVRDTGVGIAAEMLSGVFELFSQVDRSLDRSQGGLGIGLTLVRSLVELHGGCVEAHSDGLGQGSEFVVSIPVATDREARAAQQGSDTADEKPTAHRILVVDDNVDAADSLAMWLAMLGHEVLTAHNGLKVVETAAEFNPDVVLLDIGLPGIDGYEVARRLRAEHSESKMRLVALTGYGQEEDRRRTKEAGFDHHLTKPADPMAIQRLLAE